jgi:peptidoglycan/LPS O-acetylase OafA/YrhL
MFLGKISFSIYLLHTPIGTDGIINFCQNFISDEVGKIILMFATIPLIILISWIFYKYIEEPTMKLSKKIIYSKL